jgi:hypothetical protein
MDKLQLICSMEKIQLDYDQPSGACVLGLDYFNYLQKSKKKTSSKELAPTIAISKSNQGKAGIVL